MTSFDLLPREDLYELPPDFVDRLMKKIHTMERRRKATRASAMLVIGLCAIGLTYSHFRSYSSAVRYEIPVAKAKPRPVPAQVTAPAPEPRIAKVPPKPKVVVPKPKGAPASEKAPVIEASPELRRLCDDVQRAVQKTDTVPCISGPDPLEPHHTFQMPPYRKKPVPEPPPQKP